MRILELFAGIGACSTALKRIGLDVEIVDAVEIDKYAMASFNAVHGTNFEPQDITKWNKKLKDIDLITHGSPCLTKDSLILTNKGYIPLEQIKIGDLVLTKSNTWHKVNKIFDNGVKNTIYLQGMGFENIHCTPEHKFFVREMKRIGHFSKRSFSEPHFVEANKIEKKHYLGVPVIQEEISFYTDDLEFWYLIGLYLGDGWLKLGKGYDVVFGLNDNKIEKLKKNVKEEKWKWSIYNERTVKKLRFANKDFYNFINKYIGTGSFEKHVPYEILCLPKKQLLKVYEGYLDSDGCNIKNTDKFQFSSVNRNLIYSMSLIINKLFNRPTQISLVKVKPQKKIENRIINQHNWYILRFNMNKHKQDHAFYENNYIWYPFTKIENGNDENVYNMEIDTDHSYIVQGCISKNCQDFSIAGKQAGGDIGSGTRSSLMYETIRIVGQVRPKYVLWENVKNLLSKKHKHNFDAYIETMNILGYNSYYQVLNAKDYGTPQNRERVYTISIRKDFDNGEFVFPKKEELKIRLKDMLEEYVDEKYYLDNAKIEKIINSNFIQEKKRIQDKECCDTILARDWKDPKCVQVGNLDIKGHDSVKRVYSDEGISPTLTDMQGGNRQPKIMIKNATKKGYDEAIEGDSINLQYPDSNIRRERVGHQVSQTLMANDSMSIVVNEPKIIKYDISQTVKVRKYPVDIEKLKETLRNAKIEQDITNSRIAFELDVPITTVEHWFRKDNCFAIPDEDIWFDLKSLLNITTDEFDKSIMTFEEKDGIYDKANRVYDEQGVAPTLTQQEEKIVERTPLKFLNRNQKNIEGDYAFCVDSSNTGGIKEIENNNFRIRKLTPKECWRLMGFNDEDFEKAQNVPMSNTQLYKQARKFNLRTSIRKDFYKFIKIIYKKVLTKL